MKRLISIVCVFLSTILSGCAVQLSPPQLVGDQSSDVAVREFLLAGERLAQSYGLEVQIVPIPASIRQQSAELFSVYSRSAVPYSYALNQSPNFLRAKNGELYEPRWLREYFIRAGHHASQIVCRNYLSGLRDRNEYFEFLQQEMKVATNLTTMLLTLTNTAEQAKDIFTQVAGATNLGIDSYQSFKFLAPEIETILPLVEAAQVAMRDYFTKESPNLTFAGALNAVSKIEYQCSRSGIRSILTKTLVQSKPQYTVRNGTLYANEAKDTSEAKLPKETVKGPN